MQDFTFGATRWRTLRAFGANPLVRVSDRMEAMAMVLAVSVAMLAAPVAGAIGTDVYDSQSKTCEEWAHTRRAHSAIVGATRDDFATARRYTDTIVVEARWRSEGIEHTESFRVTGPVAVGEEIDIWIDDTGKRVRTPPPLRQAVADAVLAAVSLCLVVLGTTTALISLVRWRLDRHRDAGWERDIRGLMGSTSVD